MPNYTESVTAIAKVTASTTSSVYDFGQRNSITAHLIATGIGSGSGLFRIDASNDNNSWIIGIASQDATSTASTTYVTSKTLTTNTSVGLKPISGFQFYRTNVIVTTDGTYSVILETQGS